MTTIYKVYAFYNGTTDIHAQWVEAKALRKYQRKQTRYLRKTICPKGKIKFFVMGTVNENEFGTPAYVFTKKGYIQYPITR